MLDNFSPSSPFSMTSTMADTQRLSNIVPPAHPFRTLVLCFDGTGDQFDSDNSNVVQFLNTLKKDNRMLQRVYYQSGIGTYTNPQYITPLSSRISKTLDEAIAWNLQSHVMDGYVFIMQNYTAGDRICIFGFSRGAYTARALAGMIHKVGLLPAWNLQQVPFAYKMYTDASDEGWKQSTDFKRTFSIDVDIEFIGVWDTVNSVGLIPHRLPFTTSNTAVRTFRHAVSLDERRAKFKANLWNRPTPSEARLGTDGVASAAADAHMYSKKDGHHDCLQTQPVPLPSPRRHWSWEVHLDLEALARLTSKESTDEPQNKHKDEHKDDHKDEHKDEHKDDHKGEHKDEHKDERKYEHKDERKDEHKNEHKSEHKKLSDYEAEYGKDKTMPTDIEEVWFSGCHCDVGGGSVRNDTRHSLARIPLRWMIRECFKTKTGIIFEVDKLRQLGLDPDHLYPKVLPRPPPIFSNNEVHVRNAQSWWASWFSRKQPTDTQKVSEYLSEEQEDLHDALSPKYDQLHLRKAWWLLEFIPMKHRYQRPDTEWVHYIGWNRAQPRVIPCPPCEDYVKVHRTVKIRMEAERDGKKPRYKPKAKSIVPPLYVD